MEKMRKTEARKIVQEGVDIFFEEMKKGGCPIEVGRGDIRTEEDIAKIHQEMEGITWSAIRSQYILSLDLELIDAIAAKTSLSAEEIKNLDMGEIEKKLDIKACAPKIYFAWEEGEKMGLQLLPYKFVPKEVIDKRERQMDMVLKNR